MVLGFYDELVLRRIAVCALTMLLLYWMLRPKGLS